MAVARTTANRLPRHLLAVLDFIGILLLELRLVAIVSCEDFCATALPPLAQSCNRQLTSFRPSLAAQVDPKEVDTSAHVTARIAMPPVSLVLLPLVTTETDPAACDSPDAYTRTLLGCQRGDKPHHQQLRLRTCTFCAGMQPNATRCRAAEDHPLRTNRGRLIICDDGHPHVIGLPSSHGGGKIENIEPPKIGIHGNSHMFMQDRNNLEITDWLLAWIDRNIEDSTNRRAGADRPAGPSHMLRHACGFKLADADSGLRPLPDNQLSRSTCQEADTH